MKTIDFFRGISVIVFIVYHLSDWWLLNDVKSDVFFIIAPFIGRVFGPTFVFIAGVSTFISYNNRMQKVSEDFPYSKVKNEYLFRALLILILGLIYNLFIAIATLQFFRIWTWFILLSIGFSLFMVWPLLETKKSTRLIIAALVLFFNNLAYMMLAPSKDQANLEGILYFFLFHSIDLDPIFSVFPFMLTGTVLGQQLVEIYKIEDDKVRAQRVRQKVLIPSIIVGISLMAFTFLFLFDFFIQNIGFSWMLYSLGFCLLLYSIPLYLEQLGYFETKKSYRFLYYFSYYSLFVYLGHNLLYFLFFNTLNLTAFILLIIPTVIIYGLILHGIYEKWGSTFSIKVQIGRMASRLAEKVENGRMNHQKN